MKSFACAVFLLGAIAPLLWESFVFGAVRFNPYRSINLPRLTADYAPAGYAAASAVPFFISGWLLSYSLKDKSLVWPQRCMIGISTTIVGIIAFIWRRPMVERLFR